VNRAPPLRYNPDNQTPLAQIRAVRGLRPDTRRPDQGVGWGNLARNPQTGPVGSVENAGRLRISTITRADGLKKNGPESPSPVSHPLDESPSPPATQRPPVPPPAGATPLKSQARRPGCCGWLHDRPCLEFQRPGA